MSDRSKFEELVHRHHRSVFTFALSLTKNPSLADEATHLTFVKAWTYLDSFRGDGSFEGWLMRICRRVVIDLVSSNNREVVMDVLPERATQDPDQIGLVSLLDTLPLPQREVVTLCGVLGYDYQSASEILGIPIGTVRSRLNRARASLRKTCPEAGVA